MKLKSYSSKSLSSRVAKANEAELKEGGTQETRLARSACTNGNDRIEKETSVQKKKTNEGVDAGRQ